MSESDNTWNADNPEPTAPTPWMSLPPTTEDPTTEDPTNEDPTNEVTANETPTTEPLETLAPYPPYAPTAEQPTPWPAWPPVAPGPPAGPVGWPAPPPNPAHSPGRRALAVVGALALVLASAGIGAGVAVAVHHNSNTDLTTANGGSTSPNGSSNGNGNGSGSSQGSGLLNADAIAAKVDPGLVNINTTLGQSGRAAGTGMIITSSGEVLTNNHVIADATSIKVTIGGTGPTKDAHVIGYDVRDDVALLQIDGGVSNLPTVTFGDPGSLNVGDPVVAIGNALGRGGTPTAVQGSITALDQRVTAGDPGGQSETLTGMIETDAPIQPGDSGGALVDKDAKVIGMNTAAAAGRFQIQTGTNIGYAIRVDNAVTIVKQIRTGNDTDRVHIGARALLGVQVRDASAGDPLGQGPSQVAPVNTGALVTTVQSNSGASAAGIHVGDVIVSVNDASIADQSALHLALTVYHPGDNVKVGWVDVAGTRHNVSVTLGNGPPA